MGFLKPILRRFRRSGLGKDKATGPDSTTTTSSSLLENTAVSVQPAVSSQAAGVPITLSEPAVDSGLPEAPAPPPIQFTQPAPVASAPERGNDKYGLFPINLNAQGLGTLERDHAAARDIESYPIDIVALHGITGDAYNTWTHGNNKLWLRDFLNDDLPGARIFSYGYDAGVFFSLATGGFEEFAGTLLGHLKQTRTSQATKSRPIIFICHSMGGIIVKEAIITTLVKGATFENIRQSCLGIIFLGTPHRGSKAVGFPKLLTNIVNIATVGTSRLFGRARTELIKNLEREAPILDSISGKFVEQTASIKIATFVEMEAQPPAKERIVDRHSAVMHVVGEQVFDMQGCNHTSMCRFPERNGNYGLILGVLKEWTEILPSNSVAQEQLPIAPSLSSLKFPEMYDKILDLDDRTHSKTGTWIFKHPAYVAWHNDPQGILWIKGKPGAGKSTTMKTLVDHFELQKSSRSIVLIYFFNAFGDPNKPLKNSAAGMYRVLLVQLLEQVPSAAFRFQRFYERTKLVRLGHVIEWRDEDQNQIRKFLNTELENLDTATVNIRILVDAIDEDVQGKAHVEEIGRYLFDLDNRLRRVGKNVRVCVSSRHFPLPPVPEKHTIVLEKENLTDITVYVEDEFKTRNIRRRGTLESDGTLSDLRKQIVEKSAGVFLWVALVIPIVVDRLNKGDPVQKVMSRLDFAPPRLGEIYTDMLNNIIQPADRGDAYSILSWAAKATDPMYLAQIATDVRFTWPFSISTDNSEQQNNEIHRLGDYVGSYSGGLIEARFYDAPGGSGSSLALFIHHTVRTFLQETGLQQLRDQLPVAGSSAASSADEDDEDEGGDEDDEDKEDEEDDENAFSRPPRNLRPRTMPGKSPSSNPLLHGSFSREGDQEEQYILSCEAQSGKFEDHLPTIGIIGMERLVSSTPHILLEEDEYVGKSDSYEPAKNRSLSSLADRWLETLQRETMPLLKANTGYKRVRIAVLDTGVDITNDELLAGKEAGVIKSISGNLSSDFSDTQGHGTHVVSLLLKIAPMAEIYVAKVTRSSGDVGTEVHSRKVLEAIKFAIDRGVDIISMSFGFERAEPAIQEAIQKAHYKGIIMFAATSHRSIQTGVAFPASSRHVIGISSADGYGNSSSFNPGPIHGSDNFSILGEAVKSAWPKHLGQGPTARKSGTSFATPIAAAIAANVLEYARQNLPLDSPELSAVSSPEGIRSLFSYMSSSRGGYAYVVPWKLLSNNQSQDTNLKKFIRVLNNGRDAQVLRINARERTGTSQGREIFEVNDEEPTIDKPDEPSSRFPPSV